MLGKESRGRQMIRFVLCSNLLIGQESRDMIMRISILCLEARDRQMIRFLLCSLIFNQRSGSKGQKHDKILIVLTHI